MSLDPQSWGFQNVFTELDTCGQPRFVQIRFNEATALTLKDYVIDLGPIIIAQKLDMVQGVFARIYNSFNPYPANGDENIANPPFTNTYSAQIIAETGFTTTLGDSGQGPIGVESHRPLSLSNSPKMVIRCMPSNANIMEGINLDLVFTNFRVRPYDIVIPYPSFI